jgi:hypothetical protein
VTLGGSCPKIRDGSSLIATAKKQMKRLSGLRPMSSIHKTRPSKSTRHDRGPSWKVFGIGLILASVQGRYRHRSILRTVRKLGLFPNPLKQSVTALAAAVFLASDAANMLQPDDAGRQA